MATETRDEGDRQGVPPVTGPGGQPVGSSPGGQVGGAPGQAVTGSGSAPQSGIEEYRWALRRLNDEGFLKYGGHVPELVAGALNAGFRAGHILELFKAYRDEHGGSVEAAFGPGNHNSEDDIGSFIRWKTGTLRQGASPTWKPGNQDLANLGPQMAPGVLGSGISSQQAWQIATDVRNGAAPGTAAAGAGQPGPNSGGMTVSPGGQPVGGTPAGTGAGGPTGAPGGGQSVSGPTSTVRGPGGGEHGLGGDRGPNGGQNGLWALLQSSVQGGGGNFGPLGGFMPRRPPREGGGTPWGDSTMLIEADGSYRDPAGRGSWHFTPFTTPNFGGGLGPWSNPMGGTATGGWPSPNSWPNAHGGSGTPLELSRLPGAGGVANQWSSGPQWRPTSPANPSPWGSAWPAAASRAAVPAPGDPATKLPPQAFSPARPAGEEEDANPWNMLKRPVAKPLAFG